MAKSKKTATAGYTKEQRAEWTKAFAEGKMSAKEIERLAGVSPAVPYQWKASYLLKLKNAPALAASRDGIPSTTAVPQELEALRAENERLRKKLFDYMVKAGEI